MLIVKKFGGTSVADKERIFNVARRCIKDYQAGHDVVVVLSAMGKQTDVLIDMAKDINPNLQVGYVDYKTGMIYTYMSDAVSNSTGHMLNAVFLNGEWKYYDACPLP